VGVFVSEGTGSTGAIVGGKSESRGCIGTGGNGAGVSGNEAESPTFESKGFVAEGALCPFFELPVNMTGESIP